MPKKRAKILIIDDDRRWVQLMSLILGDARFNVVAAFSGREGIKLAYREQPDLVLLDIMMPGMDGFATLDQLRAMTDIPIIMLTGVAQIVNEIRSLDKGAMDFVGKGEDASVLIARIRSRLRQFEPQRRLRGPRRVDDHLEFDLHTRVVRLDGKEVNLTPIQRRMFECLAQREGRVATVRELVEACWENPEFQDERAVKVQISMLRKKLHDRPPPDSVYIHTVRAEGYRFGLEDSS
jgi:DNA-binding response OmpR family regulator